MSSSITNQNSSLLNLNYQQQSKQKKFLKFCLEPDTKAMFSIQEVTEVLKLQLGQIIPIPQMSSWVMGVHNWRGEILWVIDLGHLIGLYSWYQKPKNNNYYDVIVISSNQKNQRQKSSMNSLGLVVTKIEDIEWCNPDLIQSPPASAVTDELAPFLQGYFLNSDHQMNLVLNGNSIVSAMPHS